MKSVFRVLLRGKAWLAILLIFALTNFFLLGPLVHSAAYPLLDSRSGLQSSKRQPKVRDRQVRQLGKGTAPPNIVAHQPQLIRFLPLPHEQQQLLALENSVALGRPHNDSDSSNKSERRGLEGKQSSSSSSSSSPPPSSPPSASWQLLLLLRGSQGGLHEPQLESGAAAAAVALRRAKREPSSTAITTTTSTTTATTGTTLVMDRNNRDDVATTHTVLPTTTELEVTSSSSSSSSEWSQGDPVKKHLTTTTTSEVVAGESVKAVVDKNGGGLGDGSIAVGERGRPSAKKRSNTDEQEQEAVRRHRSSSSSSSRHEDSHPGQMRGQMHRRRSSLKITGDDIERLLHHEMDIVVNRLLLEMRGQISCGGRPIMELRDFEQVVGVDEGGIVDVVPAVDVVGPSGGRADDSAKPRFHSCAVVGNSGDLLEKQLGSVIDAADAVIRFNAAPTRGYEAYVGKRTTIRIQNVDHLGWRENNREKMAIFTGRSEKDVHKFVNQRKSYPQRPQYMFNPEWWCHIWDWVKHRGMKPSTGLAGIVLALHVCSSVQVFGFSHNATRFHYFNKLPAKVTTKEVYLYHPLIEEAELYQDLAKLGYLTMY